MWCGFRPLSYFGDGDDAIVMAGGCSSRLPIVVERYDAQAMILVMHAQRRSGQVRQYQARVSREVPVILYDAALEGAWQTISARAYTE